jgi:hypothetical protein
MAERQVIRLILKPLATGGGLVVTLPEKKPNEYAWG